VEVGETWLGKVLSGDQRYLVPLYQRPYSWTEKQLARLWADLLSLTEQLTRNEKTKHFTGSLVLDLGRAGPGTHEYLVVDGQQRLTTLSILLCALRDHVHETEPDRPEKRELIHERYLVDKYRHGDDRLKLLPTQADRDDYRALVDGSGVGNPLSRVTTAYRFFRHQLRVVDDPEDPNDVERIQDAALGALAFVSITSRGEDNVYRIFESLNNTGMKLTQGDLLRNYIFMRLGSRSEEAYSTWWLPMQDRLTSSDLEALFWMDLVASDSEVKQGDIYSALQDRMEDYSDDEVFAEVKRYAELARLLEGMRNPEQLDRFGQAVQDRLTRLKAWGGGAADPLILFLLSRANSSVITAVELETSLGILESFFIRRLVVGASPNALSRILLRAPSDMRKDMPMAEALSHYFSTGRKFFASDDQVREAVLTKPMYYMGKPHQKKLLLQWLEATYASKEPIDLGRATIEHVLPQTLTPFWRDALTRDAESDESAESIHESIVHTLGNLTLTAYNSELSNRDFDEKRILLNESGIRLNAAIAAKGRWGRAEIEERGRALADRIVATWVAPSLVSDIVETGATWATVRDAVEAVPPGRWTTYGDLAVLASTYAQPVAAFVARENMTGAWRVLKVDGTIAPGFHWSPNSEHVNQTPREVLEAEGLTFDSSGRANPERRVTAIELAELIGIEFDLDDVTELDEDTDDRQEYNRFVTQLAEAQTASAVHGVLELIRFWRSIGGELGFGNQAETSCFFMARRGQRHRGGNGIWPFTLYPKAGTIEVVFQYLKDRPPFDRLDLRQELRSRLNRIDGIEIAEDRIGLRPSFRATVLESEPNREALADVLRFFMDQVVAADQEFADMIRKG
jgi:alkylated DNA nucleotide flippase Atl1